MTDRPAIKPLVWGETSYGTPEVNTVVGVYRLNRAGDGGWRVSVKSEVLFDSDGRTNFATIEAAKAAAQADFTSRIRSCLLDKPEAVEGGKGWRVFENIFPGEFGIEDLADPDGDAILPPRRIDREHLDRIVSAYNAACHGGNAAKLVKSPPPVAAAAPNEITDFLYKHGDLTYSAASSAIRLLTGNGYGFTRAALTQEPTHE